MITEALAAQYSETGFNFIHDGSVEVLPKAGTLVAIETASRGLVNMVTTGNYSLRKSPVGKFYNKHCQRNVSNKGKDPEYLPCSNKGEFLITIECVYADNNEITNSRFLDEIYPPLTIREKAYETPT